MKNLILLLFLIFIIVFWLFPVEIAIYKDNYWLILLYIVWWIPSIFITGIITIITDEL